MFYRIYFHVSHQRLHLDSKLHVRVYLYTDMISGDFRHFPGNVVVWVSEMQ